MTTPFTPEPLDQVERRHIEAMLRHTMGNKRRAAQLLGISRSCLIAKVQRYAIEDRRTMSRALDSAKVGIAVDCRVCGLRKAPVGRSVPLAMHLCDHECPGYWQEPIPGSLWPGESEADFGYPVSDVGTEHISVQQ